MDDNPPPYDDNGKLPNWSSDEKAPFKGKGRALDDEYEDDIEKGGQKGQLRIKGNRHDPLIDDNRQLTLSRDREALSGETPRLTVSPNIPTQRISASYFRPQPTLEEPLQIDLRQDVGLSEGALILRNRETGLAPVRLPPGMSKDEQLALVLSEHPEIDFDDALKMLEDAEDDVEEVKDEPENFQLATRGHVESPAPRSVSSRQSGIASAVGRPDTGSQPVIRIHSQQKTAPQSTVSLGGKASSISPSESASQVPKSAAEQEDEDFQLALELSRQDSGPSRSVGESSRIQNLRPLTQIDPPPARGSTVSMSSLLQNSSTPRAIPSYRNVAPQTPVQPLFSTGTTSSLLGGSHNALLPRPNAAVEQQRLSDLAAIKDLQAERAAQRNMAEHDLYSQLSTPQDDRATKAQLALAREDLRDSKLATQMTSLSLNQNRLSQMRRHADEDEIARAQRQVDAEARRRFELAQAESRKQEAMEKARLRDRRWQTTQDELREQEERDRAFALELSQMQHDQVIEKVDAFGRNTQQNARRPCPVHGLQQSLDMRTYSDVDGDRREITYEASPSLRFTDEEEETALQGWDDYERSGRGGRHGSGSRSSSGRGRGRARGWTR